jgi:ABC-2 type transport system ATP-binding protein
LFLRQTSRSPSKTSARPYGKTVAVEPLSFSLTVGSTRGLLGGNSAGKTTAIGMIMGLLEPSSGSIHAFGHDMARERYQVLGRMNFESPYVDIETRPRSASPAKFIVCGP